ncbi:tRNA glutamyl-Q(34) synthetase GluQRS [Ottowia sp. GY511]|uniref:Glutamyl-Q tRNA(Asp) synthetase n=1 Tax=Ottowia flava TaxID=2675430 RepID=A0ABW4KZW7_9BURK|nr:tRNA glutamyl-Q(34) synthetase GluQRS [Ottowia sp. GY511]TXK26231.1 tRNA glutamyl-Q(34) synthetase GluQRS [Ottowia sp. GY511]
MVTGRFAPSPTGPLHAGSLVAALASWLDVRAQRGRWLVRIEDVDLPRCVPGADRLILQQLAACGLVPDEPPVWQSLRGPHYEAALRRLVDGGLAYGCACSRKDIALAQAALGRSPERGVELPYPGTCRPERGGLRGLTPRAWRLHIDRCEQNWPPRLVGAAQAAIHLEANHRGTVNWSDRRLGPQRQAVAEAVGDFVLRRADGLWAYQLAVVVDDAAQGVTHIVRGEDLIDNTPRQLVLQRALGLPHPTYLHTPLVLAEDGEKLSKQNGALALDTSDPLPRLRAAAEHLGLPANNADTVPDALAQWVGAWRERWATHADA